MGGFIVQVGEGCDRVPFIALRLAPLAQQLSRLTRTSCAIPYSGSQDVSRHFGCLGYVPGPLLRRDPCCAVLRCRFERLAGTATAKWHVSIKVLPSGMTLGKWLQQHGLPILQVGRGRMAAGRVLSSGGGSS
jgi:hypothetical protein